MVVLGDDGGFIEITKSEDSDIWIRTLNDSHDPVRIRTFFGGGMDTGVYDLFNEFMHKLEKLKSKQII